MPSESKQARETQKKTYERAIQMRRSLLVERGADEDRVSKDPHLRHLRAKLRKTLKRTRALQTLEKQEEEMALRKQRKLEAKTEEEPADSPEKGKTKQKKEKKKQEEKT